MNDDELIKIMEDKLYELYNEPLPYERGNFDVEVETHPAALRAQSPLLNYLDTHPQEITNADWATMYFHLCLYPAIALCLMIYLALIDY